MNEPMTIGVIGMGRMGQAIIALLESEKNTRFYPISRLSATTREQLKQCDVAIEFTVQEAAPDVIKDVLEAGIPIVSGTTGWHADRLEEVREICQRNQGKLLYATNFSIGMNIVFALNEKLAHLLQPYSKFKPTLKEVHHVHKKDMPSGTALTLLRGIMDEQPNYVSINLNSEKVLDEASIPVLAVREGEVKGYHEINWDSGLEKITLAHEAYDRNIFASGAIATAKWLTTREPGIYTMKDFIST